MNGDLQISGWKWGEYKRHNMDCCCAQGWENVSTCWARGALAGRWGGYSVGLASRYLEPRRQTHAPFVLPTAQNMSVYKTLLNIIQKNYWVHFFEKHANHFGWEKQIQFKKLLVLPTQHNLSNKKKKQVADGCVLPGPATITRSAPPPAGVVIPVTTSPTSAVAVVVGATTLGILREKGAEHNKKQRLMMKWREVQLQWPSRRTQGLHVPRLISRWTRLNKLSSNRNKN